MNAEPDTPLRYNEDGNVHLDFHGAVNTTIDFIVARYGIEAMHEIFRKVGRDVYQDLRRHLMAGDARTGAALISLLQGPIASPPQLAKPIL